MAAPSNRLSIRGGSGLGDAIYLQSVACALEAQGFDVEVCCDWPDVFRPVKAKVSPFRREPIDRLAHYSLRRHEKGTTQFQDCCIQAGLTEPVDLWMDWSPVRDVREQLTHHGKPVVIVQMPRPPFGRKDGYGMELLPDCAVIQRAIDHLQGKAFLIQVGHGKALYKFSGIDLDLTNKTSVVDLLDVAWCCDAFLGYCSFIVPMSEAMNKPSLCVWSRRGLKSSDRLIRSITPQKIFYKASSSAVTDDCTEEELARAVDALLEKAGRKAVV